MYLTSGRDSSGATTSEPIERASTKGHMPGFARAARHVGLNTIYQVGSQTAPAVAALLAIPFLLRHLGPELFGIVTIFSTALLYFTMLDLGLGRAATRFIAQSMESGRSDDLRRYLWGSVLLLLFVGVGVALICLPAVSVVVSHYLKIPLAYSRATSQAFYIICVTVPVVTLTATFRGYLEASGRFLFVSVVAGSAGVGNYAVPVVVILMGGGLVGIAAAFAAVRVAACVAFAGGSLLTKHRPSLRPIFDIIALRRMLSFGGWLSVSNIVGTATIYCDRLLLGTWVGMVAVTSYGLPLDVISRLQIIVTSFCSVLFPVMSRLDESGSPQFQTLYRGAIALAVAVMTPLAALLAVAAPFLMKLWLRQRVTPDSVFAAQVFLAGAVIQSVGSIAWTALHARGRSDLTAWVHLAEFPVYCGAFYFACTRFGVRGAALVWLARVTADFLSMVILFRMKGESGAFRFPAELTTSIVSLVILLIAFLPLKIGESAAAVLCTATWIWVWRVLLNSRVRTQLGRVLLGRRNFGTAY